MVKKITEAENVRARYKKIKLAGRGAVKSGRINLRNTYIPTNKIPALARGLFMCQTPG